MQELQVFVGVDVAKAELVVARHGQTGSRTIPNQAQAISAWLRELPDGACLAMESTGRHHQMLASLAQAAGLQVFVLNARDVHFYAKALGARTAVGPAADAGGQGGGACESAAGVNLS